MMRLFLLAAALFAAAPPAFGQLYETKFDDDVGWTFDPASNPGESFWHVTDCIPVFSPPFALRYVQENCAPYTQGSGTATGPPIDLSSASEPLLVFWCGYDTEDNDCFYDLRHVQVSNDDFATMALDHCFSIECPWRDLHPHYVPLDSSWGTVRIRFFFDTIDGLGNCCYGWAIDDISVVDDDPTYPRNYCESEPNSATTFVYGAAMGFDGTTSIAANNLRLKATRCPPNQLSLFLMSQSQNEFPAGNGTFCLGGPFYRMYPASPTGGAGTPTKNLDYGTPGVGAPPIVVGSTWNFQNWFRDPPGGGAAYNFSDGLEVTFAP